ncbi:unnamed protein product [Rhodiola kirilowii]
MKIHIHLIIQLRCAPIISFRTQIEKDHRSNLEKTIELIPKEFSGAHCYKNYWIAS